MGECGEKRGIGEIELRVVQTHTPTSPQIFYLPLHFPIFPPCSLYFLYTPTYTPYLLSIPTLLLYLLPIFPFPLPFLSPVKHRRKNFLFRFSSRIYPARNFLRTAKISLQNYRKQLTKSPACGKIVSYLHILSNVTIRRKRVDKSWIMW